MKKLLLIVPLLLFTQLTFAQDEEESDEPKEGWVGTGTFSLLFNQAAFNAEWRGGGTSNYAGNATEINESHWYYSVFANFRTQFAKGYEYDEVDVIDETTGNVIGEETVRTETTHFMSPGYLQVGPGMLWKKNENFKVNIAPATARFIFVDDRFTTVEGYEDGDYFGVDQGESMRFEFGASVTAYAKFDLVENVTFENMLNLYANYLEDPQNVDLDYTGKLNMKVNDYLSANFIFQTIYDDNAVRAFQVREVLGVGFTYKINPQE